MVVCSLLNKVILFIFLVRIIFIFEIVFNLRWSSFLARDSMLKSIATRRLTGNNDSGAQFFHYFGQRDEVAIGCRSGDRLAMTFLLLILSPLFFFSAVYFSQRSSVWKKNNLRKLFGGPNNIGVDLLDILWPHGSNFGFCRWCKVLQVISKCPVAARLVFHFGTSWLGIHF